MFCKSKKLPRLRSLFLKWLHRWCSFESDYWQLQ